MPKATPHDAHGPEHRNFDTVAATWDEEPRRLKLAHDIAGAIVREISLSTEQALLDYGAGTGLVTLALAPRVGRVLAVDGSAGMLDVLRRKLDAGRVENVEVQQADLERSDSVVDRFHVIVSSMTLHHVENPGALLRTLGEHLEPDGSLAIADLEAEGGRFHPDPTGVFHEGFTRGRIAELFEEAGLGDVRVVDAATIEREHPTRGPERFGVFLAIGRR